MTSVASECDIPIVVTEHYIKVFGKTITDCFATPEIQNSAATFEKKLFSMYTPEVKAHMDAIEEKQIAADDPARKDDPSSIILCGIEAHVCVQQTCLDLLEAGKDVHIIVDAVTSQQSVDRDVALQRMQQAGAFLTTAQSAVFMLAKTADAPYFKALSKLTVEHMKKPNEFNDH